MECCVPQNLLMERRISMSKKLITLTPVGRFYFGGDATFETNKGNPNSEYSSYIVKSNIFPQQTSLLGMLRYLILSNDEIAFDRTKRKIINTDRAKTLIGEKSFCVSEDRSFGYIKQLFPCFLQMKKDGESWKDLFFAPKDYKYELIFMDKIVAGYNEYNFQIPEIVGFDPKSYKEDMLLSEDGDEIKISDIFTEDSRVGINKDYEGVSQDSGFYKQISYRLGKEGDTTQYRFAFYADINGSCPEKEIVSLGGDNSQFVLQIIEKEQSLFPECYVKHTKSDGYAKIVLLSDSFVNPEIIKDVMFSISETIPFRYLGTTIKTESYDILSAEVRRSERLDLYKKGSVFYFENEDNLNSFASELNVFGRFSGIGYNTYQIFK